LQEDVADIAFSGQILLAGQFLPYTVALLHSTLNEADIYDFVTPPPRFVCNP